MGLTSSALPDQHWSDILVGKRSTKEPVCIAKRAELLKQVTYDALWQNFLDSTADSFAIVQSDVLSVMKSAGGLLNGDIIDNKDISSEVIQKYTELWMENTGKKSIDFMAIYITTILLNDYVDVDTKIDLLYDCIDLSTVNGFDENELYIALSSMELGLSIAFNIPPANETVTRSMCASWMEFMEVQQKSSIRSNNGSGGGAHSNVANLASTMNDMNFLPPKTVISRDIFFDFCNNRQLLIRRLLEILAVIPTKRELADLAQSLAENVVDTVDEEAALAPLGEKSGKNAKASGVEDADAASSSKSSSAGSGSNSRGTVVQLVATGGDEWMANPAWKKTAEKMIQPKVKVNPSKPESTLELDWVHGYRGYDCRNNLRYMSADSSEIVFHAASLTIAQSAQPVDSPAKSQYYFGEHSDDILCLAVYEPPNTPGAAGYNNGNGTLIATGEIGKTPSICVYSYTKGTPSVFTSLSSLRGFHKKGVSQLCFSADGCLLYTIGVEYSIGVYNTDRSVKSNNAFGKLLVSVQGPKGLPLHVANVTGGTNPSIPYCFSTSGEKHVQFWNLTGSLSKGFKIGEEKGKLGINHKAKTFCTLANLGSNCAIAGTGEGDLILFNDKRNIQSLEGGHTASVNAMYVNPECTLLVTGGADNKVIVWAIPSVSKDKAPGDSPTNGGPFITPTKIAFFKCNLALIGLSPVADNAPQALKAAAAVALKGLSVRSVCLSADNTKVLMGTQSCQIIECNLQQNVSTMSSSTVAEVVPNSNCIMDAHFKQELWGMDVRPAVLPDTASGNGPQTHEGEYCTVGDDGYLRIWNLMERRQIRSVYMGSPARCCAYSPDGLSIAVGLGSPDTKTRSKKSKIAANDLNGVLRVYRNDPTFTLCFESKEAKGWISEIKFSPDGRTLAMGAHDNNVYLFNVNQNYKKKGKFAKHSAGILHFDFTKDGKYLQTNCNAYELLFCDTTNGQQITKGATMFAEEEWASMTCRLNWGTLGIWVGNMDGSDINSVCRSPDHKLLATADDFGKVKVYRYPAIDPKLASYNEYCGHSSHVTCVRWIRYGSGKHPLEFLISTGGEDKCIMQWRHINNGGGGGGGSSIASFSAHSSSSDEVITSNTLLDMPTGGDEFTAVKPWLGAIVTPTAWATPDPAKKTAYFAALGEFSTRFNKILDAVKNETGGKGTKGTAVQTTVQNARKAELYSELSQSTQTLWHKSNVSGVEDSEAPSADDLELDWVYGYRGYDCRNNTFYVHGSGDVSCRAIVYHAAALGIVLYPHGVKGKGPKCQRYFRGHTDDIIAMSVMEVPGTEGGGAIDTVVATGQIGMGNVFVWSAKTLKTLSTLPTKQKSVVQVAFSTDRRLVYSVGEDCTMVISDWKNQMCLITTKSDSATTYHIVAPPYPANVGAPTGPSTFFVAGEKFMRVYTVVGKNLNSTKVGTTGKGSPQSFWVCACLSNCTYFVGCEDGKIYMIGKTKDKDGIISVLEHHAATLVQPANSTAVPGKQSKKGAPAITSMTICESVHRLVTGAKDGSIVIWNTTASETAGSRAPPVPLYRFLLAALDSTIFAVTIQSLALHKFGSKEILLVGSRGCDLLEIDLTNASSTVPPTLFGLEDKSGAFLMRSHCNNELWGLATHPFLPEYCTAGDDKSLRFYDIHSKQPLGIIPIGTMARAVDYHPSGKVVVVGFGGRVGKGKETGGGKIRVYLACTADAAENHDGNPLVEATETPKQWISDIKFSPDGRTIAVGAHDNNIHLYTFVMTPVANGRSPPVCTLTPKCKFTKHNASISHLDFSLDSRYLQSNCNAYELLFSDTSNGKQITKASQLKDVAWDSWTCTLGWPVQGIWSDGMDGSDINAVSRSHSGHLVASGDDFGLVNLFQYPCNNPKAAAVKFKGHSSHVMNLRWTVGDGYLVSVGGDDKCIFQWRHTVMENGAAAVNSGSSSNAGEPDEDSQDDDADGSMSGSNSNATGGQSHASAGAIGAGGGSIDLMDMPSGGDECGSVKPWLGAIRAPKNIATINKEAPSIKLRIKWVHGYTSAFVGPTNTRVTSNLFFNADGDAIYPAAALGVKLSTASTGVSSSGRTEGAKPTLEQMYFDGHNDDILCIAISPNRKFVATGQCASNKDITPQTKRNGTICVWDAERCTLLSTMVGCHQRAVISLSFSPSSDQLLSVGCDDNFTHIIWQDSGGSWSRVTQLATAKGDKQTVMFTKWISLEHPKVKENEFEFVSGGGSTINFWKLEGAVATKKAGKFGKKYKKVPLLCAGNIHTKDGWRVVCGTSTGDLYLFDETKEVTNSVDKAHENAVLSICDVGTDGVMFITGSKEGVVKIWNNSMQPASSYDITSYSLVDAAIGSVDVIRLEGVGTKLLCGTYGGEIIETILPDSKSGSAINTDFTAAKTQVLVYSHYKGELWGVAMHPIDNDIYATVGDDATVRIWSIEYNCLIASMPLFWPARTVAWNNAGNMLAVGFHEAQKGGGKKKKGVGAGKKTSSSSGRDDDSSGGAGGDKHTGSVHLYSFNRQQAQISLQTQTTTAPAGGNQNKVTNGVIGGGVLIKRADGVACTQAWIADLKFSPNDSQLSVGSHDKKMYTYDLPEVPQSFVLSSAVGGGASHDGVGWGDGWSKCLSGKPKFVFNKHSSAILHIDYSADGKYMQTNCQAYELLYCDANTGKQETSASKLADYNNSHASVLEMEEGADKQWFTQTCVLGWPVQGIWPSGADGSDINAVDRHYSHKFAATSDDFGEVKIFRYPCVKENSKSVSGQGHSSHVTCVRWANHSGSTHGTSEDKNAADNSCEYMVSTGGNDKCVFVWEVKER